MSVAFLVEHADIIVSELKLVTTTLAVLYVTSHASLRRPASADPAKKDPRKAKGLHGDHGADEDEPPRMEGLQTSDAILFPVLAAIVLVGLYYLIQYLQDPAIINTILQWYISVMSIASLAVFYSHGLQLGVSAVFPRHWSAGATVYRVCQATRRQLVWEEHSEEKDWKAVSTAMGPLPVSSAIRLPTWAVKNLWGCRELLTEKWSVELKIHGLVDENTQVRFHHGVAVLLSISTILSYHVWTTPFFTNLIGVAFCYSSGQYLSPNCFKTAFCVLGGLFVYDIVMVFYTPYMVTVATTVDAPMKLIVETGAKTNILGLGDIAVPCMLVALALRFDLWMHYLAKAKHVPDVPGPKGSESKPEKGVVTATRPRSVQTRAPYVDVTGRWADWFHTLSFPPGKSSVLPSEATAGCFPRPYFYAAMGGYAVGLVMAMALSVIYEHGQPALLYLVPGVIGALCVTAVVRGEVRYMVAYNEDGRLDRECNVVELDERGRLVRFVLVDKKEGEKGEGHKGESEKEQGHKGEGASIEKGSGSVSGDNSEERVAKKENDAGEGGSGGKGTSQDVFLFRVSAPSVEGDGVEANREAMEAS